MTHSPLAGTRAAAGATKRGDLGDRNESGRAPFWCLQASDGCVFSVLHLRFREALMISRSIMSADYAEEQKNELEILESIFGKDLTSEPPFLPFVRASPSRPVVCLEQSPRSRTLALHLRSS